MRLFSVFPQGGRIS